MRPIAGGNLPPPPPVLLEPGTPSWVAAMANLNLGDRSTLGWLQQLAFTSVILAGVAAAGGLLWLGGVAAYIAVVVLIAGFAAASLGAYNVARQHAVIGWMYKGRPISGDALALLEDIIARFEYAERMVGAVPTGIDWREIRGDVQALLWDAAGHAARATELQTEAVELRYANPGTPQRALLDDVKRRASEYLDAMRATQLEAEQLARLAGNAAAAAKLALARTGSIYELEVVAPSARAVAARDALAAAKERLKMLAEVWEELDETTAIKQQRLAQGEPPPGP